MTADLLVLRDWLTTHGVTPIALERTGGYWKPVYDVLEEAFTCLLVNAAHMHNVPGRKADGQDCIWIAQLLECGLLWGSFVPPVPIREWRDLVRYHQVLTQERAREAQRLHKVLEDTGVKFASVATDFLGVSGRAMLDALVAGTTAPDVLAELAKGRLRVKLPMLRQALVGRFRWHHALLVSELLAHLDYVEEVIERLSEPIAERLRPFALRLMPVDAMPGVNQRTIEGVVAEIGVDLSPFPSDRHVVSWAGLCPGATTRAPASIPAAYLGRAAVDCAPRERKRHGPRFGSKRVGSLPVTGASSARGPKQYLTQNPKSRPGGA